MQCEFRFRLKHLASSSDGIGMNASAMITLVVIAGIVWGGFLLITVTALRKESRKAQRG